MLNIHIITIFPDSLKSVFEESILKRAQKNGLATITVYNLRDWTDDKRKTVDDKPFGGGAGMVMKVEPFYKAVKDISKKLSGNVKILITSAKGSLFNQQKAREYSTLDHLIILCGHYEGIDERVKKILNAEEVSIGKFVLTGGEIPAMAIADSTIRLIPGVLGNENSLEQESYNDSNLLEYPQYTRPETFSTEDGKTYSVPEVLLSGNHKDIQQWKENRIMKQQG